MQPAVVVVEAARLVDGRQHRQVVHLRQLKVLAAAPRRDVHDPRSLVHRDVLPGDDAVLDRGRRRQLVERAAVAPADELRAPEPLDEDVLGVELHGHPLAVFAPPVLLLGVHRRRDVRRHRPGRRRPHDEELAVAIEEREAHVERRVGPVLVDARLRQLVLRQRRAAARAPLRRAVAHVQPAALLDDLQELPDVLDVRVAEREVVAAPVHPLSEALRPAGERLGRPDDDLAAAACELLEAELLALPLRVEPEFALDPYLDPEPLAVEAVLVALVEAAERLVALEDVLQRATPRRMDAERKSVRGHGAVDERPVGGAAVPLAELFEGLLPLPDVENLQFQSRMIGFVR